MTTSRDSGLDARNGTRRSRLTLDLDPELHLRMKIAAAQARLSMREYVEQMLREHVPSLPQQAQPQHRPIASDVLERLARTRQEISGGRVLSDATEIIRRMRDGASSAIDP
jgi:hypothetical protein